MQKGNSKHAGNCSLATAGDVQATNPFSNVSEYTVLSLVMAAALSPDYILGVTELLLK